MRKYLIMIVIFLGTILLITNGFTLAKYVSNTVWNYYLNSQGFYLSSDQLGNNVKNVNNVWDGTSIHFNLKNNINDALVTDYDIKYKVTCTLDDGSNCKVNGTDSNVYYGTLSSYNSCVNNTNDGVDTTDFDKATCEVKGYDWVIQKTTSDIYFDVENDNVTANIEVVTTEPYEKKLTGTFILKKDKNLIEKTDILYQSFSNYDRLTVTNSSDTKKCVKINWDANKLRIDNENITNYNMSNGYINEIILEIPSKDNLSYIFYKVDKDATYDINEFSLLEIECN